MLILTIRTDKPDAELGLYEDRIRLAYVTWQAHRILAETIHRQIQELLASQHKQLDEIKGIVGFEGPGSFTGLRIGLTVANTLGESLPAAIVGVGGEEWLDSGIEKLLNGENERLIMPEYGAPVHITEQKK